MGRKFWKQDRQKIELTKRGIMGELQNEYNIEDVIKITKKPKENSQGEMGNTAENKEKNPATVTTFPDHSHFHF